MKKTLLVVLLLSCFIGSKAQSHEFRYINATVTVFAENPSNNDVFSGDNAGLIKRSTDNGLSWEIVYKGDATIINDIEFVDATNAYATTNANGLLLVSNDGGQSWSQKMMLDSAGNVIPEMFHSVEIINSTTYIINPTRYTGSRGLITTDAGATFKELQIKGTAFHAGGDTLIAFGKLGFGMGIYHSYDLGTTWNPGITPTGLHSNNFLYYGFGHVEIINSTTFTLTGNESNPDHVFITTDGGVTFATMVDPVNNFYPYYTDFSSATTGIIAGRVSSAFYGFYSTTDGGQTWTPLFYANGYSEQVKAPFFKLSNGTLLCQRRQHIAYSTDGAMTFNDVSDDIAFGTNSGSKITILDDMNLYSVASTTQGKKFMYSEDGGMNWFEMYDSTGASFSSQAGEIVFLSPDTAIYAQYGGIRRYVKNGNGSGRVLYSETGFGTAITDMIIDKKGNIWATTGSKVYYSTDRAKTWTIISGTSFQYWDNVSVQMTDISAIYAQQTGSLILSTDTGKTWNDVTNGIAFGGGGTNSTNGICVRSADEVMVYGNNGRLYRTRDAGTTWTDLRPYLDPTNNLLNYYDFRFMNFRTDSIGYAGDYNANGGLNILITTDGGFHWNNYTGAQASVNLITANFADSTTGVIAGTSGPNIIRYYGDANYTTDSIMAQGSGSSSITENSIPQLQIFPNPAHQMAMVKALPNEQLIITDLTGRSVALNSTYQNYTWVLDLSNVKAGVYIIYNTATKATGKLVVQ